MKSGGLGSGGEITRWLKAWGTAITPLSMDWFRPFTGSCAALRAAICGGSGRA